MAKKTKAAEKVEDSKTQGRAVMLPDGTRRVDYIRSQYYDKGVTRSEIRKALCELTKQDIPYQIVFAATKVKPDDYKAALKAKKVEAEEAKKAAAKAA